MACLGFRAAAGFDADPADVLADDMLLAELVQFLIAGAVVEILRPLVDGHGRARREAGPARAAGELERRPYLKGHIRQDRHQTKPGPELGIDEQVIPADPAQPRQNADLFVGDMRLLIFPIDDLRRGDGQGFETETPDMVREQKSSPVQKEIELAVVVKIERRRPVDDILKDRVQDFQAERDSSIESRLKTIGKQELVSDLPHIRDAEQGKAKVPAIFPEPPGIFFFLGHRPHSNGPALGLSMDKLLTDIPRLI